MNVLLRYSLGTRYSESPGILTGGLQLNNLLLGDELVLGDLNLGDGRGSIGNSRECNTVVSNTGVSEGKSQRQNSSSSGGSLSRSGLSTDLNSVLSLPLARHRVTEGVLAASLGHLELEGCHWDLHLLDDRLHDVSSVRMDDSGIAQT